MSANIVGIHDGKCMDWYRKEIIEYQHAGDCAKNSIFIPPGTGADQKDAHHEYHKDVLLGHAKVIQDQSQYAAVITIAAVFATYAIFYF